MQTRIVNINKNSIQEAIEILKNSGIVAFPTETVYGLGCDFSDTTALKKIFEVKGRSFSKPLAAHISKLEEVEMLADDIPNIFFELAEKFLPGPLSIVLKKKEGVSEIMTAGMNTVAIRFPSDNTAHQLISQYGKPLAATSANVSGRKAPISAKYVLAELNNKIPFIIDGGETKFKIESTVISLVDEPLLLREGAISVSKIEEVLKIKLEYKDK